MKKVTRKAGIQIGISRKTYNIRHVTLSKTKTIPYGI